MVLGFPTKLFARVELGLKQIIMVMQGRANLSGQTHQPVHFSLSTRGLTDRISDLEREVASLRATEQTLRDHQKRFQSLANLSPVGVFRADSEGNCTYSNARCCEMIGLSREEAQGLGWTRNVHPDDREPVLREWHNAVRSGSTFKCEYRFAHHDRIVWVMGEALPELDAAGQVIGYIGALSNITERKKTETFLQQSETRLKMALRTGRIVAWEWDARTNKLVRSDNATEVLGLPLNDIGFPSTDLLAAVDDAQRDGIRRNLETLLSGSKFAEHEFQMFRPDNGKRLWIASQAEVIQSSSGKLERIVGVSRDVTVRRTAQESLESTSRFLAQTLDALPSHIAILDEQANILSVNAAWKKFADENGFECANYGVGQNYLQVCRRATGLYASDAATVALALEEMINTKRQEFYFEYPCHSRTQKRWFMLRIGRFQNDSSVRLLCSHYDITEVKLAAEALRESETRFRQLADSMPQIVWSATPEGTIDYQNKKFVEQTGLTPDQAASPDIWHKILHPEDAVQAATKWEEAVRSGNPFEMEYRYIDRASGYRWHLGRALPVRDRQGKISRWFGTCTDIEEQKKIEQALEQARQQLSQHAAHLEMSVRERTGELEQSMKHMESFCYSIAHDLRAPLRAMQGFTTALFEDYSEAFDLTGREYAHRIVTSAQRMERLIQDLLNYGRLSHIEISFEPVDLEKVLDVTLSELAPAIQYEKAIIAVKRPLPCVRANHIMLQEILHNLVSNALKFVEQGVTPRVEIWSTKSGDNARVYVKDNGVGIEPEYHERIFRVFEKVHGSATEQATGIGLAIVRKSLERLGGQVGVESKPGEGSCFWFELPECERPMAARRF